VDLRQDILSTLQHLRIVALRGQVDARRSIFPPLTSTSRRVPVSPPAR
jgi:hypothetical protein